MMTSLSSDLTLQRIELDGVDWQTTVRALDHAGELRLWRDPDGRMLVGLGEAFVFDASNLRESARALRDLGRTIGSPKLPAFVASAFDPNGGELVSEEWKTFRRVEVVVPEVTLEFHDDIIVASLLGEERDLPALDDWLQTMLCSDSRSDERTRPDLDLSWRDGDFEARVEQALSKLGRMDDLKKVVAARRLDVTADRSWSAPSVLNHLSRSYPECFLFAVRRGDSTFLGATPERLVRVDEGRATTGALAGSAARGDSPAEDDELGRQLLASAKNLDEHGVVAEMIRAELEPIANDVQTADAPSLRKLSNVQHLFTPISADLHAGVGLAEVATRLHPTPAVGGMPRDLACSVIRELEDFDRGLYAGFVGWMNAAGDGDVSVAIRSGLLRGHHALLYAGSGIVSESKPSDEADETRAKLRAVLSALRGDAHD